MLLHIVGDTQDNKTDHGTEDEHHRRKPF